MTEKSHGQSAQRRKSPHFGTLIFLMVFITLWVVGFGCLIYQGHVLLSEGRLATATITKKVMHPAGEGGYRQTTFEEDFVFTTADGNSIEGKRDLTPVHWDRIRQGDTFTVTYAASDPQHYVMGTVIRTRFGALLFPGVLVLWVVFMTLMVRALHTRPAARRSARSRHSQTASSVAPGTAPVAPRPIVAKTSISGPVLFGTVLFLCGAFFLLIGVANLVKERAEDGAFRTKGKAATAVVFTKSSVTGKSGDSYPLGVRFTTDEGNSVEATVGVEYPTMTSIHEHEPIRIIYLPAHPAQIRLASEQPRPFLLLWFVSALGGIVATAGVISIAFSLSDARRHKIPRWE